MAEWQYRIERVNFQPGREADVHLEKLLRQYRQQGWELVQVLHGHELTNDPEYRLIFKAEKPLGLADLASWFSRKTLLRVCGIRGALVCDPSRHGRVRGDTILENGSDAGHDFQTLSNVGIDIDAVTEKLQAMGRIVNSAYDRVLTLSGKKREKASNSRNGMIKMTILRVED